MAVLLYENKISQVLGGEFTENVITNRYGDSYTQTIVPGLNTSDEEWSIEWIGLTQAEARALKQLFQAAKGSERFLWQSPLDTRPEQWTVESHRGGLMQGSGTTWEYSCTMSKRF